MRRLARFSKEELNALRNNKTPITMASVLGRAEWVRALTALGCEHSLPLPGGVLAIHLATKMHHADTVAALCEAGADPHHGGVGQPSALSLALSELDWRCYAVLVEHFIRAHEGADREHATFEALRAAIAKGSSAFLQGLLSVPGSSLKVTERVVAYCAREGSGAVMEVLLQHGGSVNSIERGGPQEVSAVVLAAGLGNASSLAALLANTTNETVDLSLLFLGLTALMHSAKEGHVDCVRVLLASGANVNQTRPTSGWTALCFAANKARLLVVEALLAAGADPCIRALDNATALHLTTDNRVVERLLQSGADPNALDKDLRAPLYRPALVSDYLSVMHLLRYGADARFAHRAHKQKAWNDERVKEDPSFVRVLEVPTTDTDESIDIIQWLPEYDRAGFLKSYQEECEMGIGTRSRVTLMLDLLNRGPLWIRWTTSCHSLFPRNVRVAIRTALLCRNRREAPLSCLPRDVFLHLCSFIASPSALWRELALREKDSTSWEWNKEFSDRCWEYDVSQMVSAKVQHCLDMGQCTKHLTGSDFIFQPFYKCTTCKWGEEFGNNLGMCRSCRDSCHRDHDTRVSGFLPAFCDCGDSARCCLDSQWSLLAEEDDLEVSMDGNKDFRFLVSICHFHDPDVFREIRRPEKLLHAVPGDLLKVERKKLDEPGLICEGRLHGELGTFPASRSYVLPLKEFVRALEDSTSDAGALPFKRGDLILPIGTWDGNLPEGMVAGSLIKGKLISPAGPPFREGWVHVDAVDLVVNYDVFSVDSPEGPVNHKRNLSELFSAGRSLALHADPRAITQLQSFRDELRKLVPESRDTFRLGLMRELAAIESAEVLHLLRNYDTEQELLREVVVSLESGVHVGEAAKVFCTRARTNLVISLVTSGNVVAAVSEWKSMISSTQLARDTSGPSSLLRLLAFVSIEVSNDPANALEHCERLLAGASETGIQRVLFEAKRLMCVVLKARNDIIEAYKVRLELLHAVEESDRPLELLVELLQTAKFVLSLPSGPQQSSTAAQMLQQFISLYEEHPSFAELPSIRGMVFEAYQYLSECAHRQSEAFGRLGADLLVDCPNAQVTGENLSLHISNNAINVISQRGMREGDVIAIMQESSGRVLATQKWAGKCTLPITSSMTGSLVVQWQRGEGESSVMGRVRTTIRVIGGEKVDSGDTREEKVDSGDTEEQKASK
jgi:ankyrin repeat protein